MSKETESMVRFSLMERIQHIVVFVTFTLLALTGLPQKYSSLEWAQTATVLMGGIDAMRLVHRICAILLIAAFVYHVVRGLYGVLVKRSKFDMAPGPKDLVDVLQNIGYLLGFKKNRPRFGRFSYIEKFDYWAVFWGMAIMAGSGLILWFPVLATRYIPGIVVPSAKAAHSDEALLAISAIILWHLYNTHLNPRIFPFNASIFTGRIPKDEMMTEHALEYEQRTGERVPDEVLNSRPIQSRAALAASSVVGVLVVALFVTMITWALRPPSPPLRPSNTPIARQQVLPPPVTQTENASQPAKLWQGTAAAAPVADFSAEASDGSGSLEGQPPLALRFADRSSGEITSWKWDFGDGQTSAEQAPQHTYQNCPGRRGLCTVTLTVCGPGGCDVETKAGYIWVSQNAVASAAQ